MSPGTLYTPKIFISNCRLMIMSQSHFPIACFSALPRLTTCQPQWLNTIFILPAVSLSCIWVHLSHHATEWSGYHGPSRHKVIPPSHCQLGLLLRQHNQLLWKVMETLWTLSSQVMQIDEKVECVSTQLSQSSQPRPISLLIRSTNQTQQPHILNPGHYSGDLGKCRGFLLYCSLVFKLQPSSYSLDKFKIAYIMGLLRGDALAWATKPNYDLFLSL